VSPSLDIVIVNWNTAHHLQACLRSVTASDRRGWRLGSVVVLDNASVDGSSNRLDLEDLPATIVRNEENRGFAAACNQGAAGLAGEYLLFLNPDTSLAPDALALTMAFMNEPGQRDVGICGVGMLDSAGSPGVSCARFPTLSTFVGQATGLNRLMPRLFKPQHLAADECRATRDVDQVIGAFFLVRRSLFDLLGGFDERFFVYFEEVDFSWRARQLGYRSVHFAGASVLHHGGVSSGQVKATRLFYSLRSRMLYGFKHYNRAQAILLVLITVVLEFPARLLHAAVRGSFQELKEIALAYFALLSGLVGAARTSFQKTS
jgi:N-acetylglucosaminyl-diphospho-decaprenol L-rhamnosyltransferase